MEPISGAVSHSWGSYPSIFNMGHKAIQSLLDGPVNVEEKVDGSQFSFGLIDDGAGNYVLRVRSKGAEMIPDAPMDMFKRGVEHVKSLVPLLRPGWTYRGEFLAKPKHNALAYDRVPAGHVILFDINTGMQEYLSYEDKKVEAARLSLECVPLLFSGKVETIELFRTFLDTTSVLGGQKIEGVVVKPVNYDLFGTDKKCLLGKFVSEGFKEVHRQAWGESNPSGGDILDQLGKKYGTGGRWLKAIQHLEESGVLVGDPKDIGPLMKEIPVDVLKECQDEIKEDLFRWAWPHVKRACVKGFPEFYKQKLLEKSFESPSGDGGAIDGNGVVVDSVSNIAL